MDSTGTPPAAASSTSLGSSTSSAPSSTDSLISTGADEGDEDSTSTVFAQDAKVGDIVIKTESTFGLKVNDAVIIAKGTAKEELNSVAAFGSIVLATPLQYDHAAGTSISRYNRGKGGELPLDSEGAATNTSANTNGSATEPTKRGGGTVAGVIIFLMAAVGAAYGYYWYRFKRNGHMMGNEFELATNASTTIAMTDNPMHGEHAGAPRPSMPGGRVAATATSQPLPSEQTLPKTSYTNPDYVFSETNTIAETVIDAAVVGAAAGNGGSGGSGSGSGGNGSNGSNDVAGKSASPSAVPTVIEGPPVLNLVDDGGHRDRSDTTTA